MTERLKVRLIKEKLRASPMRNNVVDVRCLYKLPLLKTFLTVGMLKNEASAQRLPSPAVASLRGRPSHLAAACIACSLRLGFEFGVALCPGLCVEIAVTLSTRYGSVTAGVSAKGKKGHSSEEEKAGSSRDQ